MLVRVVWIVNKVVGMGGCNASESKVALAVKGGGRWEWRPKNNASLHKVAIQHAATHEIGKLENENLLAESLLSHCRS